MKQMLRRSRSILLEHIPRVAKKEWNPRLRGEILRTVCTVAFLIIMIVVMTSAQVLSDHQYGEYVQDFDTAIKDQNGLFPPEGIPYYAQVPLHDRGFTIFPDLTEMRSWLPDMFLTSLLGLTLLFNVFWIHKPHMEYQGFVVARRMLWMLVILYFFRTWSFLVTTVPSPLRGCTGKYLPEDITTREMVPGYIKLIGQMATGSVTACTDNIYSGHTSLITILVMTFIMYSGINWLKIYATLHGAVALSTILITRLHYTVDVYIALLVASFIFFNYHFLLIIFLQGRLERYHAIKTAYIVSFMQENEQVQSEGVEEKTLTELDRKRLHLENQMALDMNWLKDEKRIIWRIIWIPLGRMIWWMDGMDLRRPKHEIEEEKVECEYSESKQDPEASIIEIQDENQVPEA